MIHPGGLGDVLLALPAMKRIRRVFPQHQRVLLASGQVGEFLFTCQLIDAWLSLDGPAGSDLFAGSIPVSGALAGWLEQCDFAVAWTEDKEGTLGAVFRNCGVRQASIQSPFCSDLKARHQSDRFLEILGLPAVDKVDESIEGPERIPSHLMEKGRSYLERARIPSNRPLVFVHPGSGSRHKCSTAEVLARAIDDLRQDGMHPLVIEGPADQGTVEALLKSSMLPKPTVLRGVDLSLLAGMLAQAHVYVGHDSGVTHLAALFGVPTVALFGPTEAERWAPRGDHVTILRGAPCACGSWEMVKACFPKACLAVSVRQLVALCLAHRAAGRNPAKALPMRLVSTYPVC